jgi:hypothetical protein
VEPLAEVEADCGFVAEGCGLGGVCQPLPEFCDQFPFESLLYTVSPLPAYTSPDPLLATLPWLLAVSQEAAPDPELVRTALALP